MGRRRRTLIEEYNQFELDSDASPFFCIYIYKATKADRAVIAGLVGDGLDILEKNAMVKKWRRTTALRTQKDEDEERQKIIMEMTAKPAAKVDMSNNERVLEAMKIAVTRAKQLAARAFQEDLIDRLPMAVEREPLYIEDSSKAHSKDKDGKKGSNSDDEDNSTAKSNKKSKKNADADEEDTLSDIDMDNEAGKKTDVYSVDDLPIYAEEPDSETEDQAVLDTDEILKKFANRYDKSYENCIKRRSKVPVPLVVLDSSDLNDSDIEYSSHLYSKATHNFDEGSSSGLLMQNAIISKCGRRYMLHNNCRCCREPWNERIDGEELHEIWSGIEEAERLGIEKVVGNVHNPPELTPSSSQNTALSQDTFLDITAPTATSSSAQAIQASVESVLEETQMDNGNKALFGWGRRLRKKHGLGTEQFIALLAHTLRDLDPFTRRIFIRQALLPSRKSYINRIADTKSGLTYAPIADELEPFEESFKWGVFRMK
ncbi:unnamed protein product [Gongylonema pulchrum]|uniref:DUF4211 domain-containing protein n=1 Tax=Gongylonema pulchrum TaxID=637853 RepID=A0A183E5S5_9BILA|nr:unnamed protein product [Gongylonema pulchrum]